MCHAMSVLSRNLFLICYDTYSILYSVTYSITQNDHFRFESVSRRNNINGEKVDVIPSDGPDIPQLKRQLGFVSGNCNSLNLPENVSF